MGQGYYGSRSHPLIGFTAGSNSDNLRGTVFSKMPKNGHAFSMTIWAGYFDSGDPGTAQLGLYDTAGGNFDDLLGRTATFNLNARMVEAADGQFYTADLLSAVAMKSGATFGLLSMFHGGRMAHGQNSVTDLMYRESNGSTNVPSDASGIPANTETQITISVNYMENTPPDTVTGASPADSANLTSTAPTYAGDFRDAEEVLPNGLTSDFLSAYQIQVRSVAADNASTGTVVWDSGIVAASGTEKTNRRFSKTHGGAALSAGQRYQWRSKVADRYGAWSEYTDWAAGDFLVAGAGIVNTTGNPTGRTTDTTPDFQGWYFHALGTSSTNVQVRLFINGQLYALSPEIAKVVTSAALPGNLFTITAAESAFGTLPNGVAFTYQIRAKASGAWSDWSAPARAFFTNGSPTVPSQLYPLNAAAVTIYPLLTVRATDPDGDALTVSARIKDSGGSLLFTRSMTYDATLYGGAGGYKYQVTGTDFATYATYKWDAVATDGDLTSAYSVEQTIVYAQGPSITITAPTDGEVLTTDTPLIQWTTTDQQKKRVRIYNETTGAQVHDSGLITSTLSEYQVPNNVLFNGTDYFLTVEVQNSAPVTGISGNRSFSVAFTQPDAITGFLASPYRAELDVNPSVVLLTWDDLSVDPSKYLVTNIYRANTGVAFEDATLVGSVFTQSQVAWVDDKAPAATDLTYWIVYKMAENSVDTLMSIPASSLVRIDLGGSVLSDVLEGLSVRAVFTDHVDVRTESQMRDQTEVLTWDGGAPTLIESATEYVTLTMTVWLRNNDGGTVDEQLEAIRAMASRRTDGSPRVACYRDERGRRIFGRVRNLVIEDRRPMRADVTFDFMQLDWVEVAG